MLRAVLILLALALSSAPTQAKSNGTFPPCELIRLYVAIYGEAKVEAYAIERGYSKWQIRRAKSCLRKR